MNANTEVPHPTPKAAYMLLPARGRRVPRKERKTVLATVTEAACEL